MKVQESTFFKAFDVNSMYTILIMTQTAYTAMPLPQSVIELTYQISNIEGSVICFYNDKVNTVSAKSVNEIIEYADFRLSKNIFRTSFLKKQFVL